MNLFFLLLTFLFLSIRSESKSKCRSYPFEPLLSPKNCGCNNITHSQMGRIFNGTSLDSRDLPYVASIFGYRLTTIWLWRPHVEINLYCTGTIIGPKFVLTQVLWFIFFFSISLLIFFPKYRAAHCKEHEGQLKAYVGK